MELRSAATADEITPRPTSMSRHKLTIGERPRFPCEMLEVESVLQMRCFSSTEAPKNPQLYSTSATTQEAPLNI